VPPLPTSRRTSLPLPAQPHVPGRGADPRAGQGWVEPAVEERFAYACDLFEAGFYWEAHEVWEARWAELPEATVAARYQQALLLVAASLHKHEVGEPEGADQLLVQARRVFRGVTARRGDVVAGLDVAALLGATEQALRGGDPPRLGDIGPVEVPGRLAVVGDGYQPPPAWPPWVQEWVLPYLAEPALWPVLLALLGHVVVVIAPLVLAVARTGSPWAVAGLVALAAVSGWLVRWEWRVRGRPGAVSLTVAATWGVGLFSAWGADQLGVL